jgi:phosphohistidine phosphatase
MDLLVVRHALAEDREEFAKSGRDDSERPITDEGRRKFERGARGLRRVVESIDLLATSGLVRARQTADLLRDVYDIRSVVQLRELEPDADPAALVRWLRRQRPRPLVAVVGHEPHLSGLVEHLLTGRRSGFIDLKKGGAGLLRLGKSAAAGQAELAWLLTAGQLRRLAR